MLIIYSLIIILTFSVFSYIILDNYKIKEIKREETRLFQTANIVADTYKRNMDDIIFAKIMVKSYANQANARVLVINKEKEVLVDSYNSYTGKILNNKELRNSLDGKSASGLYDNHDKEILQLSVPITMNIASQTEIVGAVLISASMNPLRNDILDLRNDILKVSIFALIGALFLTAISATAITRSLKDLIKGVEKISRGHLGYTIEKNQSDEIGKLIDTFNEMSLRLNNVEKNRKHFINTISHELKTPITSIQALIDSLTLGDNSIDIYKEYLNDIKDETTRMGNLVNYLMDSIKLEDISLDIHLEDIGELVRETVKFITPYATKNNVSMELDLVEEINLKCDRNKIREVLLNIIENSIKYRDTNKESNYVSISLERSKNKAYMIIEDNGLGISNEHLPNIFNRGFRVLDDNKFEGYGIGLSIVKNILDKHNWSISLTSDIGVGSKFTIEMPIL